jgi:hypothetical protein
MGFDVTLILFFCDADEASLISATEAAVLEAASRDFAVDETTRGAQALGDFGDGEEFAHRYHAGARVGCNNQRVPKNSSAFARWSSY